MEIIWGERIFVDRLSRMGEDSCRDDELGSTEDTR